MQKFSTLKSSACLLASCAFITVASAQLPAKFRLQATKLALLTDAMSSLDALRTSHAGHALQHKFAQASDELADNNNWLRLEMMVQTHWAQAVYLLSYVSLLVTGSYLVFGQYITVGALMAVSMLSGRTLGAAGQVLMSLGRWHELQQSMKVLAPFRFPHFCNDCQTVGSVDVLSERPACNNCGSKNVTSYETNTKLVPNRLLERLGRDFLRKRGYHLQQEELDPSYCYILEKTFVMLRWHNYCPKCQTNNLSFYPYIYFD